VAKYRDVADDLRRRIADGEFPVGSQIPGITALQKQYEASLGTVRAAQEILRDEGLLRTAQGEGSFVLAFPEAAPVDVLGKLRAAQAAITAAIEALENDR
jgi:DNA-binding GntR family transcriptional regulator